VYEHSGFSCGAHHIVDVLLGKRTEKVVTWGHDRLSTFGIGAEQSKGEWMALLSELVRTGCIEQDSERRTLFVTEEGLRALKEHRAFAFAMPRVVAKTEKRRSRRLRALPTVHDDALFETLRSLRKRLADDRGVPPYVVFSDATLRELCKRQPVTLQEIRQVGGVGDVKLERYGTAFVEAIRSFGTADAAG
jgi:ATP-dependent DNA helicase RecQ